MANLDAHAKPPDAFRSFYKKYQKLPTQDLVQDNEVVDIYQENVPSHIQTCGWVDTSGISNSFRLPLEQPYEGKSVRVYASNAIGGLRIIPGLLNITAQKALLDRLLHRDLSDKRHQTNVSKHYDIHYDSLDGFELGSATSSKVSASQKGRSSFFSNNPDSGPSFMPFDPNLHTAISVRQFLDKRLRWMTLGGQYDWTQKKYPDAPHPDFPSDIAQAIQSVFPEMRPESAICNLYSPGDTLSLHRDVSEDVDAGLVSLSIGCDALFIIGLDVTGSDQLEPPIVIRLRSGDAVYMSGLSRYAWHGVPRVIAKTCPNELASWPAASSEVDGTESCCPISKLGVDDVLARKGSLTDPYFRWHGWLRNKRINLNVRQMRT